MKEGRLVVRSFELIRERCPDCVISDPFVRKSLAQIPGGDVDVLMLECPVGSRSEWKGNASHPYRTDAKLRIERIPTLLKWTSAEAPQSLRLVEDDCRDAKSMAALIALQR